MTGDKLAWALFWWGLVASVPIGLLIGLLVNIVTGILLSLVFLTLQTRRDLQRQLDEIWFLASSASSYVQAYYTKRTEETQRLALDRWALLYQEWMRGRRVFQQTLPKAQSDKILGCIMALREFIALIAEPQNAEYFKMHPMKAKYADGSTEQIASALDYGSWALENGLPDEKAKYDAFIHARTKINDRINYLLYFNPERAEKGYPPEQALPLPDELDKAAHFIPVFRRVCSWFRQELSYEPWDRLQEELEKPIEV